jgi:hypothetical protein
VSAQAKRKEAVSFVKVNFFLLRIMNHDWQNEYNV